MSCGISLGSASVFASFRLHEERSRARPRRASFKIQVRSEMEILPEADKFWNEEASNSLLLTRHFASGFLLFPGIWYNGPAYDLGQAPEGHSYL
jgi:hypothetical protein